VNLLPYDHDLPWHRDQAMNIARAMLQEGAFRGIEVSEPKILRTLASSHTFKVFGMLEGICAGAVVGTLMPHWFSNALVGMEFIHFVYPGFRGTDTGGVLLDAFEQWAFANGACGVYVEQMSGIDPDRAEAFYRKHGYQRVGVMMEKGLRRVLS
jgi:GNAT superfamily N-acetyltransferase